MKKMIVLFLILVVSGCGNDKLQVPLSSKWFALDQILDLSKGQHQFIGTQSFGVYVSNGKSIGTYVKRESVLTLTNIKTRTITKFYYFGDPEMDLVLSEL